MSDKDGNDLESLREFDVESQGSVGRGHRPGCAVAAVLVQS